MTTQNTEILSSKCILDTSNTFCDSRQFTFNVVCVTVNAIHNSKLLFSNKLLGVKFFYILLCLKFPHISYPAKVTPLLLYQLLVNAMQSVEMALNTHY
jgi:hypothetical protein